MATTNTVSKPVSTPKAAAPAPVAAAPMLAPVFLPVSYHQTHNTGWPVKAQTGASVRAYCWQVAQALAKANPNGFTLAQYASALAGNAQGTTCKQPSTGWGTVAKPNGTANAHANWFKGQGWLQAPASAAQALAKAAKAQA